MAPEQVDRLPLSEPNFLHRLSRLIPDFSDIPLSASPTPLSTTVAEMDCGSSRRHHEQHG